MFYQQLFSFKLLARVTEEGGSSAMLESASEAQPNEREVVLAAVIRNGHALLYATDAFKNDREIVMAAVTRNALRSGMHRRRLRTTGRS